MIRHVITWNYAEGFTAAQNRKNAEQMKKELENLKNLIPGIQSITVYLEPLDTSQAELMLDSVFENEEALKSYIVHPEHVRVATNFVKPFTKNRKCYDFQ